MPILKVGALMRYYLNNQPEVVVRGATVLDALQDAVSQYPDLKFHVFDSEGKLRRHINVFVNGTNVRDLKGLKTRLKGQDRITLLASISGG
ncbi:MAG: MoaD/ThiS family protein [Chloroflexi bacterium]|nr:MoaD/ThiS family protein [Chloroflexota bacterium]